MELTRGRTGLRFPADDVVAVLVADRGGGEGTPAVGVDSCGRAQACARFRAEKTQKGRHADMWEAGGLVAGLSALPHSLVHARATCGLMNRTASRLLA
jgi:hypothetical protein